MIDMVNHVKRSSWLPSFLCSLYRIIAMSVVDARILYKKSSEGMNQFILFSSKSFHVLIQTQFSYIIKKLDCMRMHVLDFDYFLTIDGHVH